MCSFKSLETSIDTHFARILDHLMSEWILSLCHLIVGDPNTSNLSGWDELHALGQDNSSVFSNLLCKKAL